jgi:hypothetical protein
VINSIKIFFIDLLVKTDFVINYKTFAIRLLFFNKYYIFKYLFKYLLLYFLNNKYVKAFLTSYQRQNNLLKDYYNKVLTTSVK